MAVVVVDVDVGLEDPGVPSFSSSLAHAALGLCGVEVPWLVALALGGVVDFGLKNKSDKSSPSSATPLSLFELAAVPFFVAGVSSTTSIAFTGLCFLGVGVPLARSARH